jgi:hypothetical protein
MRFQVQNSQKRNELDAILTVTPREALNILKVRN